jgi:hypothetical protein
MTLFLDLAPSGGGIAIFAGVAFFFVFIAVAFIAYKLLKKTVKMAFRVAVVGIIVAIAIAGGAFFLALGTSKPVRPTQRTTPAR